MALLEVKGLSTKFFTDSGTVEAVNNATFSLKKGEVLGLVGESGSGKSVLSMSILGLIESPPGRITSGEIMFDTGDRTVDLLKLSNGEMQGIRGRHISMIFQEPMTSLDPVFTIGDQIGEVITVHEKISKKDVRDRVVELLKLVKIPSPEKRMKSYPHELSGGMRQRAMIAMALACTPKILIADEPTTALDVTIQAGILDLILKLKDELQMSVILVTHDFGVVAEMADRVMVMYAGEFVEEGPVKEIFGSPLHPYTIGLIDSMPSLKKAGRQGAQHLRFPTIPGRVPDLKDLPACCYFADRCSKVKDKCKEMRVPADPCDVGRLVRCFYAK